MSCQVFFLAVKFGFSRKCLVPNTAAYSYINRICEKEKKASISCIKKVLQHPEFRDVGRVLKYVSERRNLHNTYVGTQ